MDQNAKKKLAAAKKLIQENKYAQALQDLEIMVYKYSKLFQVHLMTGLCYTKLGKDSEAEKEYLEVLDLKPDQPNAIRQLCDLYTRRGDAVKSAHYLQGSAALLKKGDPKKYREMIIKLIDIYEKDSNLQKIDPIFQQYVREQENIGEDFVRIAQAQFRIGVRNECFNLQKWELMGMKDQTIRSITPAAREGMNRLIVDVSNYLRSVARQYQLTQSQLTNSLVQMKFYFPEAASILMLLLFDQYCVGQLSYSPLLLSQIHRFLQAYFNRIDNGYLNLNYTQNEMFSVCLLLSFQYLSFFKEFFVLDELLLPFMPQLASHCERLQSQVSIREDYRKKIRNFILKECRQLNTQSRFGAVENRLQELKSRILKLEGSFLQEVIAKIALNCVFNYEKINDLKNMLKLRIRNLKEGECAPHLYKYYYEYLIKIGRVFKSLDQEIPLAQILNYITVNDLNDRKYHLQLAWFQFCMGIRTGNEEKEQLARLCLAKIRKQRELVEKDLKSIAIRRIIVLKVFLGEFDIEEQIQSALQNQRSFQNLQCAGFYYYYKGKVQEALLILKEAFRLNQMHYHTNRLLFLCLLKASSEKEAITFLQRIKDGFSSVFWINYLLAISYINQHKFQEGQKLLSTALQSFEAGVGGFRYFYQRTRNLGPFSIQFLIQQNDYAFFFQEIIFPEEYLYSQCEIISTNYFQLKVAESRVILCRRQGELLKILGRTKSALNYLVEGYLSASTLTINSDSNSQILLEVCLLKKQYATLLFYMRQFKQSQMVLDESQALSNLLLKNGDAKQSVNFLQKLDNEIKALAFQISVQRLSVMIRFESYEMIDDYLTIFRSKIVTPSKPSLNFLKNKYQFHILEYMHERSNNKELQDSIQSFLNYFQLQLSKRCDVAFENRLFDLNDQDRKAVRQAIEDYYIVLFLRKHAIEEEQLLHMLQIFPRSISLLVLFGMTSKDLSKKTASFLKCIQMEKESTISIDILASLYLRQKNYLPAAKLFLKSLQVDLLNVKCYLGLAICLFCLICRAVETKSNDQLIIIQRSLVRINSYMEYLRLQDPSQNYHILSFLRLLLNSQTNSNFEVKLVLQSAQSFYRNKQPSLLGELLSEATSNWGTTNIWKNQNQKQIVEDYLKKLPSFSTSKTVDLVKGILQNLKEKIKDLHKNGNEIGKQLLMKHVSQILNEIGISINLYLRQKSFDQQSYSQLLTIIQLSQELINSQSLSGLGLNELKGRIKAQMFDLLFLREKYIRQDIAYLQCEVFPDIKQYSYLSKYHKQIPKIEREIGMCLLKDPSNDQIRSIYNSWIIGIKGIHLRKAKLSYKLQILNQNNENNDNAQRCFKKMTLLYRDDSSFILYIQNGWNNQSRREWDNLYTWLRQLNYLSHRPTIQNNVSLRQKVSRLKIQMAAYSQTRLNILPKIHLSKDQTNKLQKLVAVNKLILGQNCWKELKGKFKSTNDDFDWWILLEQSEPTVAVAQQPSATPTEQPAQPETTDKASEQAAQPTPQPNPEATTNTNQNQSQTSQPAPQPAAEPAAQTPSNIETQENSNPPVLQASAQTIPNQQQTPKVQSASPQTPNPPQAAETPEQQKTPEPAQQNHLQNLTQEQKAKLLHQESIRAQLHANEELSLSKLANITAEQEQSLQEKLKTQARAAYQRARKQQKQILAKQKQELRQLLRSQTITFSQRVTARQKLKIDEHSNHPDYAAMHFNDYMFDMQPNSQQDFMITISTSQPLAYYVTVYKNHDGVYLKSAEYDEQDMKRVKVYQNNNALIVDSSYYFQDVAMFNATGNSTYTFRFINSKEHALVMLRVTHAIQANQLNQKITVQDISSHSVRSRQLVEAFSNKFYSLDTSLILEVTNRKKLSIELKIYSIYTLVEIFIFYTLVFVQIQFIKRLLGSSSIV